MLVLLVGLAVAEATTPTDSEIPAAPVNITQLNHTLLIDYTNTIYYSLSQTAFGMAHGPTVINSTSFDTSYTVYSIVVTYVPTLFWVKRVLVVTPAPTDFQPLPPATQALRSIVLSPAILCGATFGVVFLGGGLWTYRCRKPRRVIPPPVRKASGSDSMDSVKKGSKGSGRSAGSGRKGSGRKSKV
jgi:hypothetical protein